MRKFIVLLTFILQLEIVPCACADSQVPHVELVATDSNGKNFTIEVYRLDESGNRIDVVFFENSNPHNKIYGHGTDLRRGFYYINTDTPLFDISFPKGEYKTMQPFKNILDIYYCEDDFFIAPKDTKDPEWRIPYIVHKANGKPVIPTENETDRALDSSTLNISDFLTSDMKMRNISDIFHSLSVKGFSEVSENSDEVKMLKKDNCTIDYYLEMMGGGKGEDCFSITFPSIDHAKNFIQFISKSDSWTPKTNYLGNTIGWKKNRITIEYFDVSPESVNITYKR